MNQLLTQGQIVTLDPDCPRAEAMVIVADQFGFVGSESAARDYIAQHGLTVTEIDLGHQTVIPGLNDAHLHFLHYVRAKQSVNLFDAHSRQEVLRRLAHAAEQFDRGQGIWLSGEGWNQDYFEDDKRFPTRHDLDQISTEIPIIIMRACFHVGVLNSRALSLVGLDGDALTADKRQQFAGLLDLDQTSQPTGIVRESLFDDIKAQMPAPPLSDLIDQLVASQQDLFCQGITSIQSDDVKYVPGEDYPAFCQALAQASLDGRLKVRYGLQALVDHQASLDQFLQSGLTDFSVGRVRFSAIKILTDGSLGARTAYLSQDYHDAPGERGLAMFSDQALNQLIATCQAHGLPALCHAIGDAAISQVVQAVAKAKLAYPDKQPRHAIVHAQLTTPALVDSIKQHNLATIVQPIFIAYDRQIVRSRVGDDLANTSYAWRSLIDSGIVTAFSSDSPVESFASLPNIYAAVTRHDPAGSPPFLPEQAISLEQALASYSVASAQVESQDHLKGMIKPGYLADFVVIAQDLLDLTGEELLEATILQTYVGGELVYSVASTS